MISPSSRFKISSDSYIDIDSLFSCLVLLAFRSCFGDLVAESMGDWEKESAVSVAKCQYLSVFLRKFEVFSAVRKRSGKIRKIEKIKNESTSVSAVALTGLHHEQGPCPIKSERVENR